LKKENVFNIFQDINLHKMEINKEFTAIYFFRKIKRSKAKDGYKNKVVNKKIHIESLIHNF
jgi:hypothetical protein